MKDRIGYRIGVYEAKLTQFSAALDAVTRRGDVSITESTPLSEILEIESLLERLRYAAMYTHTSISMIVFEKQVALKPISPQPTPSLPKPNFDDLIGDLL